MKYLLTGASGFLGNYLIRNVDKFNHEYVTLGRSSSNDIICDLSHEAPEFKKNSIEVVIHCAGKAHAVPKSQKEKEDFFKVNLEGTINLLAGLDDLDRKPNRFIFISSVAVYGLEKGENIPENHPLLGKTPYAKSKILAEKEVEKWCEKHAVQYLILRLPLVIGKYPKGNLQSISEAIKKGRYIRIKNNHARKSMVLAEDVAKLIASMPNVSGIFNLTGKENPKFSEIEKEIAKIHLKSIKYSIPQKLAKILAQLGTILETFGISPPINSKRLRKICSTLTFSDRKAREALSWNPKPVLSNLNCIK